MRKHYTNMWYVVAIIALISIVFTGCTPQNTGGADAEMAEQTAKSMSEANRQVGMPAIVNFRERRLMKMILELRDQEDLVCFAYAFSEVQGKFTYIGRCVGYGLPYSVQYTNPERVTDLKNHLTDLHRLTGYNIGKLPQPDPNGLFMPSGLSATWVMLIDPKTDKPRPMYFEPVLTVVPFPLSDGVCTNPDMNPN